MKHLLTLTDMSVFNDVEEIDSTNWYTRNAARAVTFSKDGEVYLLKMTTYNYHKLPGGGVEEGESLQDAVRRELLEEIGCPVVIDQEIGEIVEYRNKEKMIQHSFCFIAHQEGSLVPTALEAGEIEEGAETVVVKDIDVAIELLEADQPLNYEGHFIRERDLRFLREARDRKLQA